MTEIKTGVLRKIVDKYGSKYENFFTFEATDPWANGPDDLASNLFNYNAPAAYRYWSIRQVNASITISFNEMMRINSYALQTMYYPNPDINYPTSWEAYVSTNNQDWILVDYQKKNEYLNQHLATKRFFFNSMNIKKFKIVQLSNTFANTNADYTNCLTLKRIELYHPLITIVCRCRKSIANVQLMVVLLVS